jgi:hypothetical protein
MYALFAELGAELEAAHRRIHHDEDGFAALSQRVVREARLHERFDLRRLVDDVIRHPRTLEISESSFGQPPVTVYRSRSFYIELLFWLEGTTAIHQHAFTGTFQVIAGSSLHTTYEWRTERRLGARFEVGRARRIASERLRPGDCHVISSGDRFIHALFHLEYPSISLVVRTPFDERARPQYSYELPGFRFDPFAPNLGLDLKRRFLRMLVATESDELPAALRAFGAWADFPDLYAVFRDLAPDSAPCRLLAGILRRRFPDLAPLAVAAHEELHRQRFLVAKRAEIKDADQRYLLALLVNLSGRKEILGHLARAYPRRDPRDVLVETVRGLTSGPTPGLRFGLTEDMLAIFRDMLDGASGDQLIARCRRRFELRRPDEAAIRRLEKQLTASRLFRSLFAA